MKKQKYKNQHRNHRHITIHQRMERLAHHHLVLSTIVAFLVLGIIKYQAQLSQVIHDAMIPHSTYAITDKRHFETLRMPIEYGSAMRHVPISGE